jgi:DNA-binding NarL/FixJ family response regulator
MDLRVPDGSGVESIVRMTAAGLPCRAIVLTTYETDRDILRAVEAGAAGCPLKDLPRRSRPGWWSSCAPRRSGPG